jgi:4-hydroxy-4-methyl-2-oxoglutarate aldolase
MTDSSTERTELLALYRDLRVADVRDGLDWNLLHSQGSLDPAIRPIWRTRACGIARTAHYVAFTGTVPILPSEEYRAWSQWYYANICTYPWIEEIEPGDFIVIDQSELNVGLCGSNNTLACLKRGAQGFVSNGGVRDTDELILQKVPFWARYCSQSMVQGRLQYADRDLPVQVGGVTVHPGDIVVADGDGVIVVPRRLAFEVARYAREEYAQDKAARRQLYLDLGLELDDSVS